MTTTINLGSPVPESPIILNAICSPEIRGEASTSRLQRTASYRSAPRARVLTHPSPDTLLPLLQEEELAINNASGASDTHVYDRSSRAALVLRHALEYALDHGDVDLLTFLAGLKSPWVQTIDEEVAGLEDEEGWGIVGMAVQGSCGTQEREEGVRIVVTRWGLTAGPREGRDKTGWTPLHLASLISTPPLVSFLLTRGASPVATTNRGLTPLDLIAGMDDRQHISLILGQAANQSRLSPLPTTSISHPALPTNPLRSRSSGTHSSSDGGAKNGTVSAMNGPSVSEGRNRLLRRRRERVALRVTVREEQPNRDRVRLEREKWLRDKVAVVGVDPQLVIPAPRRRDSELSAMDVVNPSNLGYQSEYMSDQEAESENGDGVDGNSRDDLELVYSPSQLPALLDILITNYKPTCHPSSRRGLPANVIYLYARFAHYRCDESWLEELLESAVERIEQGVYNNVEDLAYMAFWAYNTALLLHLLTLDERVRSACDDLGLLGMVEELINAVHVFVIRVAERQIDLVLDAAILEHETLEDFDDVRFEGEWTLFRNFGTKKQRASIIPKASQVFNDAVSGANGLINGQGSGVDAAPGSPGIIGSIRNGVSPFRQSTKESSSQDLQSVNPGSRSDGVDLSNSALKAVMTDTPTTSPKKVTDILTGVLVVLQTYQVNPTVTVQAFSQIFFWIASELFNRILTRKKYLCRSKAIQIRMNITALDDWARSNSLPAKVASLHFEPVTQLLQWLQTQSSIQTFDSLVGTIQGMKALNPLQLRRAVADYRFEVNEGRMGDECVQYLGQMQEDWDRRRVQTGVKALQAEQAKRHSADPSNPSAGIVSPESGSRSGMPIDALFEESTTLSDYTPPAGPECFGELLDSRFMLPFKLPTKASHLIATPAKDAVYQNMATGEPFISDMMGRSSSRSSFCSARPMAYAIPNRIRELPEGFFGWMRDEEKKSRQAGEARGGKADAVRHENLQFGQGPLPTTPQTVEPQPNSATSRSEKREQRLDETTPLAVRTGLTAVQEDDYPTPTAPAPGLSTPDSYPHSPISSSSVPTFPTIQSPPLASQFPRPGLQTSPSLGALRDKAKIQGSFQPVPAVPIVGHTRAESYELRLRKAVNSVENAKIATGPPVYARQTSSPGPQPSRSPKSPLRSPPASMPHYRLARDLRTQSLSIPHDIPLQYQPAAPSPSPLHKRQSTEPTSAPISIVSYAPASPRSMTSSLSANSDGSKRKWWKLGGPKRESSGDSYDSSHTVTSGGGWQKRKEGSGGSEEEGVEMGMRASEAGARHG